MPKHAFQASIRVSEHPRVRFFKREQTANGKPSFTDVTNRVVKLVLEELDETSGICSVSRYDAKGELVWQTKHPSVQEAKWHVEFEYGLPEEKWTAV